MALPLLYVIGDSISLQYGPYLEKMLAGFLRYARKEGEEEALLNLDRPQGANGGDSSMVLEYVKARVSQGGWRPDVLFINCGLHDIKTDPLTGRRQVALADYRQNLATIAAIVKPLCRSLVWARTTPVIDAVHNKNKVDFHRHASDVELYNAAADEVMAGAGASICDLFSFTRNLGGAELFCDHVHFIEAVRAQQAAFITGYLHGIWRKIS